MRGSGDGGWHGTWEMHSDRGGLFRAGITTEHACKAAHPSTPTTAYYTYTPHTPLPRRPPRPFCRGASDSRGGERSPKRKSPGPTRQRPQPPPQGHDELGASGGYGPRTGRAAPSPRGSLAEGAAGKLAARAAPAHRLPAPPPLRRARGGAGRGVYKARGGRLSFVSCCSDASGSARRWARSGTPR